MIIDMTIALLTYFFLFAAYSYLISIPNTKTWEKLLFGVLFSVCLLVPLGRFYAGWFARLLGA